MTAKRKVEIEFEAWIDHRAIFETCGKLLLDEKYRYRASFRPTDSSSNMGIGLQWQWAETKEQAKEYLRGYGFKF